jgi:hypothetical protein
MFKPPVDTNPVVNALYRVQIVAILCVIGALATGIY